MSRLRRSFEERGFERSDQRDVQHIEPDHRLGALVLMVVPHPARRQHQITLVDGVLFSFDDGIDAVALHDEAQRGRGVTMSGRDFAGQNVLDRSPEGRRCSIGKTGIGQPDGATLSPGFQLELGSDVFEQAIEVPASPMTGLHRRDRLPGEQWRIVRLSHPAVEALELGGKRSPLRGVGHHGFGHSNLHYL